MSEIATAPKRFTYYLKRKVDNKTRSLYKIVFEGREAVEAGLMRNVKVEPVELLHLYGLLTAGLKQLKGGSKLDLGGGYSLLRREMKPKPKREKTSEKVKLWCSTYKEFFGVEYNLNKQDAAKLSAVPVTRERLAFFFRTWKNKSVGKYCLNDSQNDITRNLRGESESLIFPDYYDAEFEVGLTGQKRSNYWLHLRGLGWQREPSEFGEKVWQPPN